ncbi:MAG TPA: LuxR C-terminal-related transcriptional regulator [Jatrophihabitans sp.]|uniref:helix-turn-helix transcriptional regulator n=1 Tax=Jatrophihabitans sp. TaxID=1932789 RepID=UPI002F222CB3
MIEDDDATLARQLPSGGALDHVVCVGSISSIATLAELTARGATVFNQAAPILVLLELVQTALLALSRSQNSSPQSPPGGDLRLGELLERRKEAQRLALLTPAEIDTLRGIVGGLTATEIANQSHHSVHTVRSHIKAILSKLEVRTQVSAVAVAHRSASYRWMRTGPARFTNFGDEAG